MQTFLPYKDFTKSIQCLDTQRHGKQRIEALGSLYLCYRLKGQDFREEFGISDKWAEHLWNRYRNHPAVGMWVGFENSLRLYYNTCIDEWVGRGYNNTMEKFELDGGIIYPPWVGNKRFHASHRSNLLRKDFEFYSKYGWIEPINLPYFWPTQEKG